MNVGQGKVEFSLYPIAIYVINCSRDRIDILCYIRVRTGTDILCYIKVRTGLKSLKSHKILYITFLVLKNRKIFFKS